MKNLPKARTENLVEQDLGKETLLYDLTTHKAFNLNETLSVVYQACDGKTSFDELKRKHQFTDDFIYLALDELKRENLLAQDYQSPFGATNRREVIKKVGLATMLALPLIAGLVAPTAANAASSNAASACSQASYDLGESCDLSDLGRKSNGCFCRSGPCVRTNMGDTCCSGSDVGGLSTLRPGTSSAEDPAPFYTLVGSDATAPPCSSYYSCCDSSQTPYGSCSYVNKIPYEGSDSQYQGLFLAAVTCSCSC